MLRKRTQSLFYFYRITILVRSNAKKFHPKQYEQTVPPPDDVSTVGLDDIDGASEGLALVVGAGDTVGANDHGDEVQN